MGRSLLPLESIHLMAGRVGEQLLQRRWPIVVLASLSVTVAEAAEHRAVSLGRVELDLVCEVLVFGIVLPLLGGVALGRLACLAAIRRDAVRGTVTGAGALAAGAERTRVLVVQCELLMGACLESLLSRDAGLIVTGAVSDDEYGLCEEISRYQPEVVVVPGNSDLITLGRLVTLLDERHELRVIVVNELQNLLHVYDKQRVPVTRARDLIAAIRRG